MVLHDCVAIPEFGGFIATRRSAAIDTAGKLISPPGKHISFNKQLQSNDGILIHYLADKYNVSYHDAEVAVTGFVKRSKQVLEQGADVLFPEVGRLSADTEGNWQFQRAEGAVNDLKSFGLPVAYYQKTYEVSEKAHITKTIPITTAEVETKVKSNGYGWQVAASIAVVLLLGVLMATNIYIKPLALNNLGVVDPTWFWDSVTSEVEAMEPSLEPASEPSNTTPLPAIDNPDILMVSDQQLQEGYYMVWGSFTKEHNARQMVHHLKHEPLQIMQSAEGYYRVVYYATDNTTWAGKSLDHHRQKKFRQNIWLLYNLH